MSSEADEFEDESEAQPQKGKKIPISEMKAKLAQFEEMESKYQEAIRKEAFRDAGVNPGDAKFKYFFKAYDGELTADAIKAEAEAAGFIAPKPPTTSPQEQEGHTRLLNASVGSEPGPQQWTLAEVQKVSKEPGGAERVEAAREAGLLNKIQGIED